MLNCPFCNSLKNLQVKRFHEQYWGYCEECDTDGPVATSEEEAIRKWNTRHTIGIDDYNTILEGLEKCGWPCRLVELPGFYLNLVHHTEKIENLARDMSDVIIELLRLRRYGLTEPESIKAIKVLQEYSQYLLKS